MEDNWIYLFEDSFGKSGAVDVNFLFNEGNIYISDNHLCALWGWMQQCTSEKEYTFIHVDYHNDLKIPNIIRWCRELKNLKSINDFLHFRYLPDNISPEPYLSYDSYIQIAYALYPKWFTGIRFLTSECSFGEYYECRKNPRIECKNHFDAVSGEKIEYHSSCLLIETLQQIVSGEFKNKIILNLDIDYFFDSGSDYHERDTYWTDEKINQVAQLLKSAMDSGNVQVLTIAMSPECCGGWQPACQVMEKLLPILSPTGREDFSSVLHKKINAN